MEDFNSKHTGQKIEDILDSVLAGGGGGGATPDLSNYATKEELNDKVDKVEGKQLSTEDFTTALKDKLNSLNNYDDTEISEAINTLREDFDTLVSGDTTTAIKSFNDIIAFLNGIEDSESLDSIIASIQQQIAGKMDEVTLAAVATSGDYNDLNNKPTIPSAVTESTVSGWGFTKNAGTITEVTVNDESVGNSGKVNIPRASTSRYGVVKLTNETGSTSTSYAATANAVKKAYDLADSKQDELVSGTNVKTINGESILGSGNIEISGGSGGGKEYVKVTLSNSGTLVFMDYAESNNFPLEPNKVYYVDSFVSEGVSIIDVVPPTGDVGEYTVHFVCSGSPVFIDTFECPANWQWANGQRPTLENGTAYELSVVATKANGTYFYKAVLTPFNRV